MSGTLFDAAPLNPLQGEDALQGAKPSQGTNPLGSSGLFAENDTSDALFPPEKKDDVSIAPLFAKASDTPQVDKPEGLFGQDTALPPLASSANESQKLPDPLFAPNPLPPITKTSFEPVEKKSDPLFTPAEGLPVMAPPPSVVASPLFQSPANPLVEQLLNKLVAAFPGEEPHGNAYRNLMTNLFPLTMERVDQFGDAVILQESALIAEAKRLTDLHQSMQIQETLTDILRAAKVTHETPHGALGFLHKIESAAKLRGNPEDWHRQLSTLKISMHGLSVKLPPFLESAAEIAERLARWVKLAKVLADSTQDASLKDAVQRKETLLLGALQQTMISQKQIEQVQHMLHVESQQIDEAQTITLPAMGFTQ